MTDRRLPRRGSSFDEPPEHPIDVIEFSLEPCCRILVEQPKYLCEIDLDATARLKAELSHAYNRIGRLP